jgi:hypothetical protein
MGTLDDAIREHLELKRRLGAPEDELEQKEAEAFGPPGTARQAAQPPAPEPGPDAPMPPGPEPVADEPRGSWAPSADEDLLERDEVLPEDSLEPNGSYSAPEPLPDEPVERPRDEESLDEWQGESEPSEDVLEETPEFLEETPEHDRLWFEQKPPKDFDLD